MIIRRIPRKSKTSFPFLLSRVVYTAIDNMIIPVLSSVNLRFYIDARKPPSTGMHWPVM